jgi:class 3 adenylate cyclase/pimeloyl-ACP methyl ester carboxylesterase
MDMPETSYAKSGDVHIAYQVIGNGAFDLVCVYGSANNVETAWDFPEYAHFVTRLGSFARLIVFDKRGTGLSDRTVGIAPLEERMDDVRAVMDAAGSERAALFGVSEGGPMSMLFSATYPARTQALVLYGTFARPDRLADLSTDEFQEHLKQVESGFGTGAALQRWVASRASDESFRRAWARFERHCASPAAIVRLMQMNREIDVRHVLPTIRVPTLVLHRSGDPSTGIDHGRYLAAHIPGAKLVELPGIDHIPVFGDADRLIDEIEEFLTGSRHEAEPDRVLATVMFTDIVESTRRAAELGDRQWRALLERHDQAVRAELQRHRGRAVKSLGDGFLATFDGPARAVRCAAAIAQSVTPLGIAVRSGLHTGEIELLRDDDIGGIAVHIAARVADLAGPGEALVSSTVRDLVAGSGLNFEDRGMHALRGLPEPLRLFRAAA